MTIFNQNNMKLLCVEMYQQKGEKVSTFLILKISCEQPSFHIGMGSLTLTTKFHEGYDRTYCDLPNTFLLDEFCLQESFVSPNMIKVKK